jgi:hypothetical protein
MGETKIEWTDRTWHLKAAAKRIGVTLREYVAMLDSGLKWCGRCREWHRRERFGVDTSRGDGLSSTCRGQATRFAKPTGPLIDFLKSSAHRRQYRDYYAGPGGGAIRSRIYARKRDLEPIPDWWRQCQLERGCAYCGEPATTLDHFIPVTRGGKSEPGNLVPACVSCNSKKKNSDPLLWLDRLLPQFVDDICQRPLIGMCALEHLEIC